MSVLCLSMYHELLPHTAKNWHLLYMPTPMIITFWSLVQQVMEYANDLKQFWKRGYGHDINSKSSCILFHDLFSRLERAASENKWVKNVPHYNTVLVLLYI